MGLRVQSILNGGASGLHYGQNDKQCFDTVAFISNIMTLLPGDVIMTGTPRESAR